MGFPSKQQPSPTLPFLHHLFSLLSLAFQVAGEQGLQQPSPPARGGPPLWKTHHDKGGRTLIPGYSRYFYSPALVSEQYVKQPTQPKQQHKQQPNQPYKQTTPQQPQQQHHSAPAQPFRKPTDEALEGDGDMEVELSATSTRTVNPTNITNNINTKQQPPTQQQHLTNLYNSLKHTYQTQKQQLITSQTNNLPQPLPLLTDKQLTTLHQLTNQQNNINRRNTHQTNNAQASATANSPAATKAAAPGTVPQIESSPGDYRQVSASILSPYPSSSPTHPSSHTSSSSSTLPPPELVPATDPRPPPPLPFTFTASNNTKRKPPSPTHNSQQQPPTKTRKGKHSAKRSNNNTPTLHTNIYTNTDITKLTPGQLIQKQRLDDLTNLRNQRLLEAAEKKQKQKQKQKQKKQQQLQLTNDNNSTTDRGRAPKAEQRPKGNVQNRKILDPSSDESDGGYSGNSDFGY